MKFKSILLISAAFCVVISASHLGRFTDDVKFNKLQRPTFEKPQLGDVWKNCTQDGGPMTIKAVTISPGQIRSGQPINVMVNYTLNTKINGGSVDINVNLAGEPQTLSLDLCDALTYVNIKCPLDQTTTGLFNVSATIPFDAPQGHYTGKVTGKTDAGVEFMCVTLDFMMG